ncbi:hypothetical protein LRR18_18470, partial [Mangrovimonas sp. AS39]|uniref:hypothetical protein n=1 Tax=Mangrovimonas futianensis TaxID=2895523 RepID=UPI001E2874E3
AISYNPSHYSGHKEALPQYMVVSYPAGDDHIAFKLQVKATGQYRMAYVDQFGATTLLSDPGSLWLHIAK